MRRVFSKESFFSTTTEAVFDFHERRDAFEVLTPPGFATEVHSKASTLRPSTDIVRFTKRVMAIPFHFEMVHTVYDRPNLFVDEQLRGPFSLWRHEHELISGGWEGDPATLLRDRITYGHPLLFAGNLAVKLPLSKLFAERHEITRRELAEAMRSRPTVKQGKKLTVVITGGTGLIGGRLTELLVEKGERVVLFVRNVEKARQRFGDTVEYEGWDFHDKSDQSGCHARIGEADAVIHLAGTPLFSKRWTPEFKREMKESRTLSTQMIVEAIKANEKKPTVLITASAVGIYGTDPAVLAKEESAAGTDILADICEAWENEARAVDSEGLRTAQVRIGIVLDQHNGALKEMLPLFKLGGGGVLGLPDRWINWIHLEDVARIFLMALYNPKVKGPINAVAPHPVTNQTFAQSLAHVLRRPCLMRYPQAILKLAIGESANYASGGPRALSDHVQGLGYNFFFTDIESALRNILGKP